MYQRTFSGFSVDDTGRARTFYTDVLGLEVTDAGMQGMISVHLPGAARRSSSTPRARRTRPPPSPCSTSWCRTSTPPWPSSRAGA